MRQAHLYLLCFCFSLLTGCGDHSPNQSSTTGLVIADAYGNCTQRVVDSHNQVLDEAVDYSKSSNPADLVQLKKACALFKNRMGSSSCYSLNEYTHKTEETSYSGEIRNTCENALAL